MTNNIQHKVQITEVLNLGTEGGDVYQGAEAVLSYQYASGSDYTISGHGKLTYSRCEELWLLARGMLKPVADSTYIGYDQAKDRYHVSYGGYRILDVSRYGWFIYPNQFWTLNPGYTGRIKAYTGIDVFKNMHMYRVCYGGVRHSLSLGHSKEGPIFVDFSYRHKNGIHYADGPSRTWHTHITRAKDYKSGWWNNDALVGRKYAMFGTEGRRVNFLRSVVDGYVQNYLKSYLFSTNQRGSNNNYGLTGLTFDRFCGTNKLDYTVHNHGPTRVVTRNATDCLPEYLCNDTKSSYRYLNAKLLYNIDTLAALNPSQGIQTNASKSSKLTTNPRLFHRDTPGRSWSDAQPGLEAIGNYSVLFQAMLAMRGLNFLPTVSNCASFIKLVNNRSEASSLLADTELDEYPQGFRFKHLCCKEIDKFRYSQLEGSGGNSADYYNRHSHNIPSASQMQLHTRRGFIAKFLEYMCATSSGGLDKPRQMSVTEIRQLVTDNPNARMLAENGRIGYDQSNREGWVASEMFTGQGMYTGKFVMPEVSDPRYRYQHAQQQWISAYNRLRPKPNPEFTGLVQYGEPSPNEGPTFDSTFRFYRTMNNPYPRIIFFLMFDEYCSNSMFDKQQLIALLEAEWKCLSDIKRGETQNNTISFDMSNYLPLTWEIMKTFLTNRISGLFLPLFNGSQPGSMPHGAAGFDVTPLYGLSVLDENDTGSYYYSRNLSSPNRLGNNVKPIHLD